MFKSDLVGRYYYDALYTVVTYISTDQYTSHTHELTIRINWYGAIDKKNLKHHRSTQTQKILRGFRRVKGNNKGNNNNTRKGLKLYLLLQACFIQSVS